MITVMIIWKDVKMHLTEHKTLKANEFLQVRTTKWANCILELQTSR